MFIFIIIVHVIVAILLVVIILMQSGRGGGLTETFSGMESIFGTKTSVFLVRATTVLAFLFLFTCLSLAYLSKIKSRSLLQEQVAPIKKADTIPVAQPESKVENKIEEVKQSVPESETIIEEPTITKEIEKTEEPSNQQ